MALSVKEQTMYWGVAIAIVLVALWFLGDVILPFILGGAIAYILDPVADRLERAGFSRVAAVAIITLTAVVVIIPLMFLIVANLIEQLAALIDMAPSLFDTVTDTLRNRFPQLFDSESAAYQQLIALREAAQSRGGQLVNGVLSSALGLINILVLVVIVPVVAIYMLLDWDNMVARVDDMLPRDHVDTIRMLARDIDRTLASFIRGQGTVCLLLGTYYAVALMLAGLNFGLIVGFIAGLITFIPYVGALVGGVLAIGLALFQFWGSVEVGSGESVTYATNWLRIGIVAGIFVFGQFIEGNILTPKMVGNSVGLHPVWLLFALSVFGSLFGFVGMLVAVPIAAVIGVVARWGIGQYRDSLLYRGTSGGR